MEKPKKYVPETLDTSPNIGIPAGLVQEEFLYGKSIEKMSAKQINGASGMSASAGLGSITATGTQTFTVGFAPKLVKLNAVLIANPGAWSDGVATPSYQGVRTGYPTAATNVFSGSLSLRIQDGSSNVTSASVGFSTTGFTVNCGAFATGTVYFIYECYG